MEDNYLQREYQRKILKRNSQYQSRDAIQKYQYENKRKNSGSAIMLLVAIFVVLLVAIFIIFFAVKMTSKKLEEEEMKNWSKDQMKNEVYIDFSLLGIKEFVSLKGKTKQDLFDEILPSYKWNLRIKNSNPELSLFTMPSIKNEYEVEEDLDSNLYKDVLDSEGTSQVIAVDNPYSDITIDAEKEYYNFPNFLEKQLIDYIDKTFDKYLHKGIDKKKKSNYDEDGNILPDEVFMIDENDVDVDNYISQLARLWNTKATLGMIEGYDSKKNEFIFGDEHTGYEIDEGTLRQNIYKEVKQGHFDKTILTPINMISPVGESIKSKYKYSSIFETTTTDDNVRNTNIQLACKELNGTIVKPGEEFSFNKTVGQRTAERGFGYANAYVGGEVVQELGGGVCQVSTTLYNAVFGAGLTTTYRRSHTFEPTYITPGLDATVSFNGVDYRFINDSDYSIGIRASYQRKKCKVEIFSVPKLEKGQRQYLTAKKIEDLGYPDISIIDSGNPSKGTKGSEWQVFKVIKDGEEEIERIFDHSAKYVGHAPTAYEEDTYIDDDGKIQTSRFTGKAPTQGRGQRATTGRKSASRNNKSNIVDEELLANYYLEQQMKPRTIPYAQELSPYQPIITPY